MMPERGHYLEERNWYVSVSICLPYFLHALHFAKVITPGYVRNNMETHWQPQISSQWGGAVLSVDQS